MKLRLNVNITEPLNDLVVARSKSVRDKFIAEWKAGNRICFITQPNSNTRDTRPYLITAEPISKSAGQELSLSLSPIAVVGEVWGADNRLARVWFQTMSKTFMATQLAGWKPAADDNPPHWNGEHTEVAMKKALSVADKILK